MLLVLSLGAGLIRTSINLINELSIFHILLVVLCVWVIIVLLSFDANRARIHVKVYAVVITLAGVVGLLSTLLLYTMGSEDTGRQMKLFNFITSFIIGFVLLYFWKSSVQYEQAED